MQVLDGSFARFVYPFGYNPDTFRSRAAAIPEFALADGHKVWTVETLPTSEMLPHVGDHLNPADPDPTALSWRLDHNHGVQSYGYLGGRAEWTLTLPGGRELPICIDAVQLVLFRLGVGLLVWEVKPDFRRLAADTEPVAIWLDLLHYFRFTTGVGAPIISAWRKFGPNQPKKEFRPPFFPEVADNTGGNAGKKTFFLDELIDPLLIAARIYKDAAVTGPELKSWHHPLYVRRQMICYYALQVDGVAAGGSALDALGGWPGFLVRVRNLFHSRQAIDPSEADLSDNHPSQVPYARGQNFIMTMEGGGYVAADPPDTPFFRNTIADHVRKEYYLLFLLTLGQRFTLMRLQHRVADELVRDLLAKPKFNATAGAMTRRPRQHRGETKLKRTYEQMLAFHARIYFVQVMQREHHHRCYRRWQEVFQIARLNTELSDQLQRMFTHVTNVRQRDAANARHRRERLAADEKDRAKQQSDTTNLLITFLGIGFGVPSLACSVLGISFENKAISSRLTAHHLNLIIAGSFVPAAVLLVYIFVRFALHKLRSLRQRPVTN